MYTAVLMAAISAGGANSQWVGHYGNTGTPYMGICAGSFWDGFPGYGAYGCVGPGYCGVSSYGGYPSAGYVTGWPGAYGSFHGYSYGGPAYFGTPPDGVFVHPITPIPSGTPSPAPMVDRPMPPKASLDNKVRSQVIIDAPENAKLYVDGQLMQTTSAHRVLQTPELTPGTTYLYDLKIEFVREGKTLTEEKRIYIRAGVEQTVAFGEPAVPSDIATVSASRD
jgi:uncharacterized protein (TIGR03000 family)